MTTYSFRVLLIIDQYNPMTDESEIVDARTVDGSISLIGDTSLIPYIVDLGDSDDDGVNVQIDGRVVGSLNIGQTIDTQPASTSLISFNWPLNGVQQSTTILAINFEDPLNNFEVAYVFVVGGTPLPEISSAAEFEAFGSTLTNFGSTLLHDPGPGDTIDMSAIPGVTVSENDYIRVQDDPFSTMFIPGGAGSDLIDFTGSFSTYVYLDYAGLSGPINATLDGLTSFGSISGSIIKQGIGTDSFVALDSQLSAGWFSSTGGLAVAGTNGDDTFTVSLDEQWVEFIGGPGNNTFNLDMTSSAIVRVSYNFFGGQGPDSGIVVDLNFGTVSNNGYGGTDQINVTGFGRVEIQGTGRADSIIGSAANERFIPLGGNDTIDGGGGIDMVRYDRGGISAVDINLATGIGTGTYFGEAFTHTLSNIEQIRGSRNGNDTLTGNAADNLIVAYGGDDILRGGAGNDTIFGGSGFDTVIIDANSTDISVVDFGNMWQITSSDGVDLVSYDVEQFQFNDVTLSGSVIQNLANAPTDDLIIFNNDPINGDFHIANGGNDTLDFRNLTDGYVDLLYASINGPIQVDIDGAANTGTIAKGAFGTDTLVDVNNVLSFPELFTGGLFIIGSAFDDTYNIALDGGFFGVLGGRGNDTYNIDLTNPGGVRIDFRAAGFQQQATQGMVIDVASGVVSNDGFGDTDQINVTGTGMGYLEIGGTRFADTIIGSDRNEIFITYGGNDTVDGGAGRDMIRYDRAGISAVDVNLTTGIATGSYQGVAFTQTLINIQSLIGSREGNDTLRGSAEDNVLRARGDNVLMYGEGGNDTLYGRNGNDTLFGGDGNDVLYGGAGADFMDGGQGSDTYYVDALDQINDTGTTGFDRAFIEDPNGIYLNVGSWTGVNQIVGNSGNDTIDATGATAVQSILGGAGDDHIIGGSRSDTLFGGDGDDVLEGGAGNDRLVGDDGNDSLFGGAGSDTLIGGAGANYLDGGNGSDIYVVGAGDVVHDSGTSGFDSARIADPDGAAIFVGDWTGINRITGFTGDDTIDATGSDINLIVLGGDGNDMLVGGNGNDRLFGGDGNDTLYGGAGNDLLISGSGANYLDGGDGSDFYLVAAGDVIHDSGLTGSDSARIADRTGVEIQVGSWTGIDRISGFTGNDTIDATGSDTDMTLLGGNGDDLLIGGNGDDTILGGTGIDVIFGGDGDDVLIGDGGDDSLYGGAGDDILIGGAGGDFMDGGEGSDTYIIQGADMIHDTGTTGFDRARINNPDGVAVIAGQWIGVDRIDGFTGNDTITAAGATAAQFITGGDGDDFIVGGSGNDSLFGGAGDDRLIGGAGDDYLVGGTGADTFVFANNFGRDVIRDFEVGVDQIEIRNHNAIDSFGDLIITQFQNNVVISAANTTDQIILHDTASTSLTVDDFIFV
ncbi:MAG: beta strand repeat-containing protein [Rhodobacterales bacterium]